MVDEKMEKVAKLVLGVLHLEYAPIDFIPTGFKVLLKTPLNEVLINEVQNKMLTEGYIAMYIGNEPEEGFVSNFTIIKFE